MEVVWQILGPLDIGSLLSFRQVNRRARQMATAMPSYRLMAEHATDALIGLHKTVLAWKFTPADLQTTLSVSTCQTAWCTQFAGYVHLPNLARYCFHCAYKCMCSCWKMRERLYSREEFLTHFRSCREAQQLWKASRGGTVAVKLERKNWKWLWENGDASRDALSQFRVPWARAKKARERGVAGDA
jgi:hypothetical protein